MAWCRQATSHYPSQCWPIIMWPYGVTRPTWSKRAPTIKLDECYTTICYIRMMSLYWWYVRLIILINKLIKLMKKKSPQMNLSEICSYKNKIMLILEHFFATFVHSNLLDDYLVQLICLTFCVKVLPNCSFIVNLDFSSICFPVCFRNCQWIYTIH